MVLYVVLLSSNTCFSLTSPLFIFRLIERIICSQAVRQDNKQRFGLLEENGELLIRANQGHSLVVIYLTKDCKRGRTLVRVSKSKK